MARLLKQRLGNAGRVIAAQGIGPAASEPRLLSRREFNRRAGGALRGHHLAPCGGIREDGGWGLAGNPAKTSCNSCPPDVGSGVDDSTTQISEQARDATGW